MDRVKKSKTFSAMEARLNQTEAAAAEHARKMQAVYDQMAAKARQEYESQIAQITARQRAAVEAKDVQTFDRLEQHKAQLRQQPVAPPPEPVPEVVEYRRQREWTQDPALWAEAAQAVQYALEAGTRFQSPADQLTYAEGHMKRKYPHLFQPAQASAPARQSPVDPGGLSGGRSQSGGFGSLPADARAAFGKFVKDGLFADDDKGRKAYVEFYHAG
jgi:hypothetical protein